MNACAASGRIAAAVVLAMGGLELEVCPDCAKTDAAGGKGGMR